MNRAELIGRMRSERQAWNLLLLEAGEERMEEPLPGGTWSLKDILAHVTAYEDWLAAWLEASRRDEPPPDSITNLPDLVARNALIYEQNRRRLAEDVLAEAGWVFDRLVKAVYALRDEELDNPALTDRFVVPFWKAGTPLWKCIAGDSYEHYHQHMPDIRRWLDQAT